MSFFHCCQCIHYQLHTQKVLTTREDLTAICAYLRKTLPVNCDKRVYPDDDTCDEFKLSGKRTGRKCLKLSDLTGEEAIMLKKRIMECQTSLMDLSWEIDISRSTINSIRGGNSWQKVPFDGKRKKRLRMYDKDGNY